MQLLTVILKDATKVNSILRELASEGVSGGTIIDGHGMSEAIADMTDLPMFNMLRGLISDEEETTCKIIMFVMKDEQIVDARKTIKRIVNLKEPNSGIMFEIPLTYVSGLSDAD